MAVINHEAELARAGAHVNSTWGQMLFLARRYPLGTVGFIIVFLFVFTAAFANVAVDTVTRMILSHPQLAHLAGDAAGSTVASRRMIVLARAASAACSPMPDDGRN